MKTAKKNLTRKQTKKNTQKAKKSRTSAKMTANIVLRMTPWSRTQTGKTLTKPPTNRILVTTTTKHVKTPKHVQPTRKKLRNRSSTQNNNNTPRDRDPKVANSISSSTRKRRVISQTHNLS